jgi:predicted GIY-YIG superfamily endonuclease
MNPDPVIPGSGLLPVSPESITTGHSNWRFTSIYWQAASTEGCTSALRKISFKKWRRDWKIRLIEEANPDWIDLFDGIAQ